MASLQHPMDPMDSSCLLWRADPIPDPIPGPTMTSYYFQPSFNHLSTIFQLPPTSIIFWPFAYALRSQPGSSFPVGWLYGCAALGDQKQWHQHLDDLFPKIRAKRGEVYPRYHFQRFIKYNVDLVCEGRWFKPVQKREGQTGIQAFNLQPDIKHPDITIQH